MKSIRQIMEQHRGKWPRDPRAPAPRKREFFPVRPLIFPVDPNRPKS